ncbi:outer membrane lipoprotein carrier protein LolA [Mesorhizobium sp. BAC0120]|uniref:outer membrane lipoprotein carrier protein LolA n=1 Tax=Mesorhizobium sp. BAC0120 TaxID=3090670 RepID=UPI00399B9EF1
MSSTKTMATKADGAVDPLRRAVLGIGLAAFGALLAGVASSDLALVKPAAAQVSATAQKIADHFSSVQTMAGEFVQFGPRGQQTGGKFYIQRPGKLRFNYDKPNSTTVVSDGRSVVIENVRLKTADLYPLSRTPLKLLLNDRIDLSAASVESVKEEDDLTTIRLVDRSVFGNAKITMMFDPKSYDLRQWTITDAQGKDTTVMIYNVKQDVQLDPKLFKINTQHLQEFGRHNTR